MMKNLVKNGLVSEKVFSRHPDLRMYKYKNKVFYKNLWHQDPLLMESRGVVFDTSGKVVARPLRKVFNYKENGAKISKSAVVKAVKKMNGFMAAFSLHKGEVLTSTTGSLDSDFVHLAEEKVNLDAVKELLENAYEVTGMRCTAVFEICCEEDPHIIDEEYGNYLIALRVIDSGILYPEEVLDTVANHINRLFGEGTFKRPEHFYIMFGTLLKKLKDCKHEGYMAYKKDSNKVVKLKSPHYLSKKWLMRMNAKRTSEMFANPEDFKKTIDEEYYGVIDYILNNFTEEEWSEFTDQQRKEYIEKYFRG